VLCSRSGNPLPAPQPQIPLKENTSLRLKKSWPEAGRRRSVFFDRQIANLAAKIRCSIRPRESIKKQKT
jgi:hypothetical protein